MVLFIEQKSGFVPWKRRRFYRFKSTKLNTLNPDPEPQRGRARMPRLRILTSTRNTFSTFSFFLFPSCSAYRRLTLSQHRSIFFTPQLQSSWMDMIKGVFTGQKTSPGEAQLSSESFTLLRESHIIPCPSGYCCFLVVCYWCSSHFGYSWSLYFSCCLVSILGFISFNFSYFPPISFSCNSEILIMGFIIGVIFKFANLVIKFPSLFPGISVLSN